MTTRIITASPAQETLPILAPAAESIAPEHSSEYQLAEHGQASTLAGDLIPVLALLPWLLNLIWVCDALILG